MTRAQGVTLGLGKVSDCPFRNLRTSRWPCGRETAMSGRLTLGRFRYHSFPRHVSSLKASKSPQLLYLRDDKAKNSGFRACNTQIIYDSISLAKIHPCISWSVCRWLRRACQDPNRLPHSSKSRPSKGLNKSQNPCHLGGRIPSHAMAACNASGVESNVMKSAHDVGSAQLEG
jgi:hypothetical protein